jgi:FtsH-binding integral membrane protein
MRKVYTLLSIQLAITTVIGAALLLTPGVKEMVQVINGFTWNCRRASCFPQVTSRILLFYGNMPGRLSLP